MPRCCWLTHAMRCLTASALPLILPFPRVFHSALMRAKCGVHSSGIGVGAAVPMNWTGLAVPRHFQAARTLSRAHKAWPDQADTNTVAQALRMLLLELLDAPEEIGLAPQAKGGVWECMQSGFRCTHVHAPRVSGGPTVLSSLLRSSLSILP